MYSYVKAAELTIFVASLSLVHIMAELDKSAKSLIN